MTNQAAFDPGFGGGLAWGSRPALLMIDMMRAYFTPGSPLMLPDRSAVTGCTALLGAARTAGISVLHTRVAYVPGFADGGLFVRKVPALTLLEEGSELGTFEHAVRPAPGETVVVKQYASAFFGTSLASTLTAMRVDTLVIAGVSTSGCIRATATDAMQHGFSPFVAADACGAPTPAATAPQRHMRRTCTTSPPNTRTWFSSPTCSRTGRHQSPNDSPRDATSSPRSRPFSPTSSSDPPRSTRIPDPRGARRTRLISSSASRRPDRLIGACAVLVHTLSGLTPTFYQHFGFSLVPDSGRLLYVLLNDAEQTIQGTPN